MAIPPVRRAFIVQIGSAVVVNLCTLVCGAWLSWPSSVIKPLLRGEVCCNVTKTEISTMVSLMDFGNILTPIPSSYLVDAFGRKPVVHSTALMLFVASACVILAKDIAVIYAARIFAGMAKGIAFGVIPMYLGEIAEPKIRGALTSMFTTFIASGTCFDYIFGAIFDYQGLNITNIIVTLVFVILFFFVPESPYFLARKGRHMEAVKNLSIYRQLPVHDPKLKAEMEDIKTSVESDMTNRTRFIDVATSKSGRHALMIVSALAVFQRLSGISPLLAYSTITLPEHGGGWSREMYVILFSFIMLATNYVAMPLVDIWGRKKLLMVSTVGCACVTATMGAFFTLKDLGYDVIPYNWVPYACLLLFGVVWSVGFGLVPITLVGELFPINVKSYANAIQSIVFAVTSLTINEVFMTVATDYGVQVLFFFFTASSLAGAVFCSFYVFETKGLTLPEIQRKLRKVTVGKERNVYTINY